MSKSAEPYFDAIADKYQRAADEWQTIYDEIEPHLAPLVRDKVVLEVGNGGRFAYDTGSPQKLIAVDIAASMLDGISDPGIVKIVDDATELRTIDDESVDVIVFQLVLHHITSRTRHETIGLLHHVLKTARRKLRHGGHLVVTETLLPSYYYALESLMYPLTRLFLARSNVSMIFFFSPKIITEAIASEFDVPKSAIRVERLKLRGWVDPLGGSFPGVIKIPATAHPARHTLLIAQNR